MCYHFGRIPCQPLQSVMYFLNGPSHFLAFSPDMTCELCLKCCLLWTTASNTSFKLEQTEPIRYEIFFLYRTNSKHALSSEEKFNGYQQLWRPIFDYINRLKTMIKLNSLPDPERPLHYSHVGQLENHDRTIHLSGKVKVEVSI